MKFIKYEIENDNKYKITLIHYSPSMLEEEDLLNGILIDSEIPNPLQVPRKNYQLYYNPISKDFWYEYFDRELTEQEKIEDLTIENLKIKNDNLTTLEACAELYELLLASQPI